MVPSVRRITRWRTPADTHHSVWRLPGRIELGDALTRERTAGDGDAAAGESGLDRKQRVEHPKWLGMLAKQLAHHNQTAASDQGRAQWDNPKPIQKAPGG